MDKTARMSDTPSAREAILDAFRWIILEQGYERVRVLDVVSRSGVARSTFYEHFQSREDLLRESLRHPFAAIATLSASACDMKRVAAVLEHMAANREMASSLMADPGTDALVTVLADSIEDQNRLNAPYAARAIAGAQMALISSWLDGKQQQGASDFAQTLRNIARAIAGA